MEEHKRVLLLFPSAVGSDMQQRMLVGGHRRLGKNRLCVYQFFSFCFLSALVSIQFWKPNKKKRPLPSESNQMPLHMRHTRCILNRTQHGGRNLLDTATLGFEYQNRPTAFPESVSKKSAPPRNLALPLHSFDTSRFLSLLFNTRSFRPLLHRPPVTLFILTLDLLLLTRVNGPAVS